MSANQDFNLKPIAIFHTRKKNSYEAARQSSVDISDEIGELHFASGQQFEQALQGIEGFSHLWLIYGFHHNSNWKPMVLPPRGSDKKIGVFATRAPYRPNFLGLSCVQFVERKDLVLSIRSFDLLDLTPVFDIKPYVAYADSFPEAKMGWLEGIEGQSWNLEFSAQAHCEIEFLESAGLTQIRNFLQQQLSFEPFNRQKKRLLIRSDDEAILAYRTWRIHFRKPTEKNSEKNSEKNTEQNLEILSVFSGYSENELQDPQDTYSDKALHRSFVQWKTAGS